MEDPESQQQSDAGSSAASDEYVPGDRDSDRSVPVDSYHEYDFYRAEWNADAV